MKKIVFILSLYSQLSWGSIQPQYELLYKEQITLPDPVVSAYIISGESSLRLEIQDRKPVIFAINPGEGIIQILQQNGEVKNILIKVHKKEREQINTFSNEETELKGHTFTVKSFYQERSSNFQLGPYANYGLRIYGNTAVGTNGYFYGRINKIEDLPVNFYLKYRQNKFYGAYGDDSMMSNEILPGFISTPFLRQFQVGYEDNNSLSADIWSGQYSPFNFGLNGPPKDGYLFINRENKNMDFYNHSTKDSTFLSGGRLRYNFGQTNKHSIFATSWYNPVSQKHIPYIGLRLNFLSNLLTTRFSVGGSSEKPVGVYNVSYKNPSATKWTLKTFQLTHQVAPKGYDTVLSSTDLPREEASVNLEFYDGYRYQKEGSVFLNTQSGYLLNGVNKIYNYGATLGWQNSSYMGYITARESHMFHATAPEYSDSLTGKSRILRPGLEIWLQNESAPVRYRVGAFQNFSFNEDGKGQNNFTGQETSWEIMRRQKSLDMGVRISRIANQSTTEISGYTINPFVTYRKDRFQFGVFTNFMYNDSLNQGSVELNATKVSAFASTNITKNLQLGASYSANKNKRSYGDVDYNQARVELTWRFGDPNRPISSIFEGSPIKGVIYEDLNFNGIKDPLEPAKEDLSVYLLQNSKLVKSTKTNSSGEFQFDHLNYETYQFAISDQGSEGIVYKNIPSSLDVSSGQSHKLNIPFFYAKTFSLKFRSKGKLPDFIPLTLKCKDSGDSVFSAKDQESKILVPTKDDCSINLDMENNNLKNFVVDRNNITLKDQSLINFNISVFEPSVSGVAFIDLNNDGIIDSNELLKKATIIFKSGISSTTDTSGTFVLKNNIELSTKIIFVSVKNRNNLKCQLNPSQMTLEELLTKNLTLKCQNN